MIIYLPKGIIFRMENLRLYLNSLKTADQVAYATACGTTVNYLRKAICKGTAFDGALARLLDEHSNGRVSKAELRPDIWPELLEPASHAA